MPALDENPASNSVTVAPSAAFELMWLLHHCGPGHHPIGPEAAEESVRMRFGAEISSFWGDGMQGGTEVIVLAHRSGTLLDLDLDAFFERFDAAAADHATLPSLLSETALERQTIGQRLGRLRADRQVRGRYLSLLESVWSAARAEWEASGRGAVMAETATWEQRLERGEAYRELIGRKQIWKGRPALDDLADASAAEGRLVLSPGWFFGEIHIVELDGTLYLGRGFRRRDDADERRAVAAQVSSEMKALADPTRIAILLWLAREPASVTEVARQFKLSQPTVSGHVQILREAGLLDEKIAGRSVRLSASEATLRRFFSGAQDSLIKAFHA